MEFVESIEKGVEPLAKALVAEPSDEGAALITKVRRFYHQFTLRE